MNPIKWLSQRDSVAHQLLLRVLAFYIAVAFVLLCASVVVQYRSVRKEVLQELEKIHQSFAPGLAQALWDINTDQVKSFFEGMTSLPAVVGGQIQDESGQEVCIGGIIIGPGQEYQQADGEARKPLEDGIWEVFAFEAPILYGEGADRQKVGTATITSSSTIVMERLMLGIALTGIQVCVAAASLCLIFILFFRQLLGRPLSILTTGVDGFDLDRMQDFHIEVQTPGRNELKVLEESFNRMAQSLAKDRNELLGFRSELESQVQERTAQLQEKADTEASLADLTGGLQGNLTPTQIAEEALDAMVKNVDAPAGALYVLEEDGRLHRRSIHALPAEGESQEVFSLGTGSIGRAGQSRKMSVLSPGEGSWAITFGLGHAPPSQVVTFPLVANDYLAGVVELYLLDNFNGTQTQWLIKAAEITAAALLFSLEGKDRQDAEERVRLILDSTPDSMIIVDEQGLIVMVNAVTERTFGHPREDLLGRPITTLVPERYRANHDANVAGFMSNPHVREMGSALRSDGSEFPVEISLNPIKTSKRPLVLAAVRDITETRTEKARLRKLSMATEQSPVSIVITERDGTIEYVNPKFSEITGYTYEEAVGQNPRMLKSGRQPAAFYKNMWDTILAGEEWHGEFCNLRKNGEEYWEQASISPVRDEQGEVAHFVAVKEDITDRKQRREPAGHDAH